MAATDVICWRRAEKGAGAGTHDAMTLGWPTASHGNTPKGDQRRHESSSGNDQGTAIAIDGKHVGTLRWHELCRLLGLDTAEATGDQVRALMTQRYPHAQRCEPADGHPYALLRSHSVTLISSDAAVCIHQRPIAADSNEIGSMPALVKQLHDVYGRSALFRMVTTDAGNTSCAAAGCIIDAGWDYVAQIKSGHGALYDEAQRVLSRRSAARAQATGADTQNGLLVTYHLWRTDLGSDGLLVVSLLRSIALAVLAVARRLSRFGHTRETPAWAQVAEHFLLQLCGSILQTHAFDHV